MTSSISRNSLVISFFRMSCFFFRDCRLRHLHLAVLTHMGARTAPVASSSVPYHIEFFYETPATLVLFAHWALHANIWSSPSPEDDKADQLRPFIVENLPCHPAEMSVWHLRHLALDHALALEQNWRFHSFLPLMTTASTNSSSLRTWPALNPFLFCV